ncbi:hypothetical protein [Bradyrhizobium sp.]|jgi:hypothetical protein|uniref:hypothetical protein n=1 Tax=Bradyrhizobium sp. TaxID=376 RepID=UPI003BAEF3B2
MNAEQVPRTSSTVGECEELASALFEDATVMSAGPQKDEILKLALSYRNLAQVKRLILRKVN